MPPLIALVMAFLSMTILVLFAFWVEHRRTEDIKQTIRQEVSRMTFMLTSQKGITSRKMPSECNCDMCVERMKEKTTYDKKQI